MSRIGTFGSFGQARLAIYAAQLGLSVTGNNISNVNTAGYTRQRLDQTSFKTGGADRYQSATDLRVGNGVLPQSISQIRDPYLDIRFRNENAYVGAMDTKLSGLDKIAAILDEVGKGGEVPEGEEFGIIAYQLGNVFQALQRLEGETGQKEYDVQVRSAVASLCQMFNSYANQLEGLYNNTVATYNENITKVNNLLTNIRDLNSAIRECDIHGDNALELRDQRNNLIDELSGCIKIKVSYTVEDIGAGKTVEKLMIHLDNANPDTSVHTDESCLVDGRYCTQLLTKKPVMNADAIYEKEGGGFTADKALAKLEPKANPKYDNTQPATGTNLPYLKEDGTATDVKADAEQVPVERTDTTYLKYEKQGGGFTNNPAEAATEPKKNPNYDPHNPDSFEFLDENGTPVKDAADALPVPKENPAYMPYLTEDGVPTADQKKAATVDLPNFGIQLAELRDVNNRLLYTVTKMEERQLNPGEVYNKDGLSVLLPDGTTKITTYRAVQQWTLKQNPAYDEKADPAADPTVVDGKPDPTIDAHKIYFKYLGNGTDADGNPIEVPTNNYKAAAREVTTAYYATDYIKAPSTAVELDDNDLLGSLQAQRELLTENGEFSDLDIIANVDENAATKRGIPYFQNMLDLLANKIATAFNEANRGYLTDNNGVYIKNETDPATGETVGVPITIDYKDGTDDKTYTLVAGTEWKDIPAAVQAEMQKNDPTIDSVEAYLERGGGTDPATKEPIPVGTFAGGNLFSVNGNTDADTTEDGQPITAKNISVSAAWSAGPMIVNAFVCAPTKTGPESTDSSNVLKIQGLQYAKLEYLPSTLFGDNVQEKAMFTGTFEEMWTNISTILGNDQKITSTLLDNYYEETVELDSNRANVSSVDFNDEAANLMMYSKSYNAACRLMTTLDSVLDKLINGTGMTT